MQDAEAVEKARAEGGPEPKRSHVAEHDKKLDQARHDYRVATPTETRTFYALRSGRRSDAVIGLTPRQINGIERAARGAAAKQSNPTMHTGWTLRMGDKVTQLRDAIDRAEDATA